MKNSLSLILLLLTITLCSGQKIATFDVDLPVSSQGLSVIAKIDLDDVTLLSESAICLYSVDNGKKIKVPFQVSKSKNRTLAWVVTAPPDAKRRTYELCKGKPAASTNIETSMKDGMLTIHSGKQNFLQYVYKTIYPPAGIDTAFRRSGFIHPVLTPNGQTITRIQAPDHYHHYGIWNPWTHVLFEGDTVDFWNLKSRQGTVRFGKFVSTINGPVFSEFTALHEHVAFKKSGKEKVALNELQTVRVYKPEPKQDYYYYVDIEIRLSCASESPFKILEYRYAGLGWRATEQWNQSNSEILTSEGKTRKDADGTTAKWFYAQGPLDGDYGGAVMMSYPGNYNFPEPVRIWPENSNNGEVFAMFAPTKTKDWLLEPGKTYSLNYRLVVFNGHFTKEKADAAWHYFDEGKIVSINK